MPGRKTDVLLLLLMGIVILLLVANLSLFLRMNQLQEQVLQALEPLQRPKALEPATQAPSFSLPNMEGQPVSLEDYVGQHVLLVFSSPSCAACNKMYPILKEFEQTHPEMAILMISRGSSEEHTQLVQEYGFAFPVLTWSEDVATAYQVPGVPWLYLIDAQGAIAHTEGFKSRDQLEAFSQTGS